MIDYTPKQPTPNQCSENAVTEENERHIYRAIWYPQMGGYVSKAVVKVSKSMIKSGQQCFDIFIWHDGDFPLGGHGSPILIHHCDPNQFIEFGEQVKKMIG